MKTLPSGGQARVAVAQAPERLACSVAFAAACALMAALVLAPVSASAQGAALFKDADLPLGEKLLAEHNCAACHVRKVGGDGSGIYRPLGRIRNPSLLRGMVDYCSNELKLSLFPEEVTAMAAVLERDHYRFAQRR